MSKLISSLKLHSLAYRKNYISVVVAVIIGFALSYLLRDKENVGLSFVSLLIYGAIVITFLLGVYEYRSLCYNYLNLKINRKIFYTSSLIFCLINAVFFTLCIYGCTQIINCFLPHVEVSVVHYIYLFLTLILSFVLANCLALVFPKLMPIGILIIIVIIFATFAYNAFVHKLVFDYLWVALRFLEAHIIFISTFIVASIVLYLFVYYEILTLNVQKNTK